MSSKEDDAVEESRSLTQQPEPARDGEGEGSGAAAGGGGWGGWGFSSFVLSDLHKAAEEISRNAVAAAKSAAKTIADIQPEPGVSDTDSAAVEQSKKDGTEEKADGDGSEKHLLRNSALDRLENASEDSLFGQGLKAIDSSVESFASGAWLALGNALKGGSTLVQKLENSAANLADSIQHGALPVNATSLGPSIIETGKSFTAKGIEVLERVGKETMELLITETGLEVEKNHDDHLSSEENFEDITFDRCYYIYGGPEQLEELEALSNHYGFLSNRKRAKLVSEQKLIYDEKLKQIQEVLDLSSEMEENSFDPDKGKHLEMTDDVSSIEMKKLHDSSVNRAADIAAGFVAVLGGHTANEIIQKTIQRLDTVHSEGVHRLSEICCFVVSQVLMLGKSVISNANKQKSDGTMDDINKVDWPEDSISKAKFIRWKTRSMSRDMESVSNSFVTGISDIVEAYQAAITSVSSGDQGGPREKIVQEKANMITTRLRADQTTAAAKIRDALQCLAHLIISTSV